MLFTWILCCFQGSISSLPPKVILFPPWQSLFGSLFSGNVSFRLLYLFKSEINLADQCSIMSLVLYLAIYIELSLWPSVALYDHSHQLVLINFLTNWFSQHKFSLDYCQVLIWTAMTMSTWIVFSPFHSNTASHSIIDENIAFNPQGDRRSAADPSTPH